MEQKEDDGCIREFNSFLEMAVGEEQVMDLPPYIPLECFESAMRSNMEADRFILNSSFEIIACDGIEGERLSENITISTCLLNSILKEYSNYYDEISDMIWFAWLRGSRPLSSERLRIIFSDLEAQQHKIIRSAQAFNTDPPLSIRSDLIIPVSHGEVEYLELETEPVVTEFDPIYSHTNEIIRETIVRPLPSNLTPYHAVFSSRNITPQSVIQLIESRFRLLPVNEQTEVNRNLLLSQFYEEIVARESLQLRIDLAERIAVHERLIEYETSGKAQRHQEELEISNIWSLVPQWRRQEREEKRFNSHWQDLSILEKKTEMNLVLAFKELKQALLDLNAYNDKQNKNSSGNSPNNSNNYTAVSSNNNSNNNSDNNSDSESNSPPISPLKTLDKSLNSSKSLKLSHIIDNKVDNFLIHMRNFIYIQPHLQYAWEFVLKYLKILSEIAIENKTIIKLNEIAHNEMKLSPIRIKEMKTEYYLNESYNSFPTSTSLCKLFQTGAYDEAFSEYDLPVYYAHCAVTMWEKIITQYNKIMNKEQNYAIAWASNVQQAHYNRDYAIAVWNVGLAGQSYTKAHRLFSKYSQISVLNNTTEFDLITAYRAYIASAHSTMHLVHIARDCVNKSIEHFSDTNNTIVFDRLMSLLSTIEEQRTFIVDNLYWCQGKLLTIILKQTSIPVCNEFQNININNTDHRNYTSVSDITVLHNIIQQWDIVIENTNNVYKLYRSFSNYLVENELFCLRSVERHVSWLDCKLKATQNLNKHILLLALFIAKKATYRYKYIQLTQRTSSTDDGISSNSISSCNSSGLYGINVPQNVRSIFGINDHNNSTNNTSSNSINNSSSDGTIGNNNNICNSNHNNSSGSIASCSDSAAEMCLTEWRCVLSTAIDLFRDDSERYNRHILKLNKVIEKFNMPSDKHALTAHDIEHIIKKNNFTEKEQWWSNMVEMIKYLKLQAENQLLFDEFNTIAGDKTDFFLSLANQTMTAYENNKNSNNNSNSSSDEHSNAQNIHNNCVDLLAEIEQIISHAHKLINSSIQNIVTTSLDLKKLTKYRKKIAYFTGCVVYKSYDLEDWFASVNHTNHMKNMAVSLDTSKRALLRVNALVCSEIATRAAEFENNEDGDFNTYSADIAAAHNAATTALHAWERLQYHEKEMGLDYSISDRQIEM